MSNKIILLSEALLILLSIILSIFWYRTPAGNYEPLIVLIGTLLLVLDWKRRDNIAKESEENSIKNRKIKNNVKTEQLKNINYRKESSTINRVITDLEEINLNINYRINKNINSTDLILDRAKIFQKKGDVNNALLSLKKYKNDTKKIDVEYYICLGKLISQTSNDPYKLEKYIKHIITTKNIDKNNISSLYWRLSVLYQPFDNKKSKIFSLIHSDYSGSKEYQKAHNIQCKGLGELTCNVNDFKKSDYAIELLQLSYDSYSKIDGFKYYNKCILSNILMTAIADRILNKKISYYKKLFYCRYMFNKYSIGRNDEAMSEIFTTIIKTNPEAFLILFKKNINEFIFKHSYSDFLVDIYRLSKEEICIEESENIDIKESYTRLMD